jgi:hypothetical protein
MVRKTTTSSPRTGAAADAQRVNIDYVKSYYFRMITPSGAMSSVTPQGQIQFGLFSERQAIPQRVVYRLESDQSLGELIESVGRDSIVREVEAIVTLDSATAKAFAQRLLELVQEVESLDRKEDK